MIIKELIIKNFKKIDDLKLEFKDGINIIFGKNEIGKSSIVEAINKVLLTEPGTSNKEILKLIPWNTDVKPFVKINFINGKNETYSIEKTFNKGTGKLFFIHEGKEKLIAEGTKIQEKIFEKIGITGFIEDLIKLLWIEQGEVLNVFNDNITVESKAYIKELIKENLFSKEIEIFYGELLSKYDEYIDKRNQDIKKTSEYYKLNEEYKKINLEKENLRLQLSGLENNIEKLNVIDKNIEELHCQIKEHEEYLKKLEIKKNKIDESKIKEHEFNETKNDYLGILKLDEDILLKENDLANYYSHKKYCLQKKLEMLVAKENSVNEIKDNLQKINEKLNLLKYFDEPVIDEYESLIRESELLKMQLEKTSMVIKVNPSDKINIKVKIDNDEIKNLELNKPAVFNPVKSFLFNYNNEFDLEVINSAGGLNTVNLKNELELKNKRINEISKILNNNDLKTIKINNKKYIELENQRKLFLERFNNADNSIINNEKSEINKELFEFKDQKEINNADAEKINKNPVENYLKFLEKITVELKTKIEGYNISKSGILKKYKNFDELKNKYIMLKDGVESLKNTINSLGPLNINIINDKDINTARTEFDKIKIKINNQVLDKMKINTRLENYYKLQSELNMLETKSDELKLKLDKEKNTLDAVKLLINLIDDEKKYLEEKLLLPLEKKIIDAFSKITNNKYTELSINENLKLSSINASLITGDTSVNHDVLSFGTKEQLAFIFRLAVADFLSVKDNQLMILDDSFVNTDDDRLDIIINLLKSYTSKIQFLIFTCKDDYDKYKNDFNWIDLNDKL